jgi:hypothetical protein
MSTYALRLANFISVDRRARSPNCTYTRCGEFIVVNKAALGIFALFLQFAAQIFLTKDTWAHLTTNIYEHKASSLHAWLTPFAFGLGGKSQNYGALGIYKENL